MITPPKTCSDADVTQFAGAKVVAEFFGVKPGDADYAPISDALGTALIHDSFLYENRDLYPDLTPGVLRALSSFGNAWFGRELAVRLYMSRDYDGAGGLATLHASATTVFLEWLESLDWLVDAVRYGKGEARSRPSQNTRRSLANRVIGALALIGAESRLKAGLQPFFARAVALDVPTQISDPVTFLNSEMRVQSVTWSYTRSGPDHQAEFVAVLTSEDNRSSQGEGASKRLARQAAAHAFIERYHKTQGAGATATRTRRPFALPSDMDVPDVTRKNVERIRHEFGLQPRWRPLLLQALVHSSWVHEHQPQMKTSDQKDSGLLAFVGSWVAQCDYSRSIVSTARETKPEDLAVMNLTEEQLAIHSGPLGLDAAMLLGKGEERNRGKLGSSSASVVQAMLAAVYVGLQTPPTIVDALPPRWSGLRETLSPSRPRDNDYKTQLQELAAACDFAVTYAWESEGPNHAKKFYAKVELTSTVLGTRITVRGPWTSTRKAAEQRGAQPIVEAFNAFGPSLIDQPPPQARGSVFALNHLLAVAQTRPAIAKPWAKRGFLGSSMTDPRELLRWARAADSFAGAHDITGVDNAKLSEFYRHSAVEGSMLRVPAALLSSAARRLTELTDTAALTAELEADVADLCAVYGAAGNTSDAPGSVAEAASEWSLLYGQHLTITGDPPAAHLWSGELHMIDCVIERMADVHGALDMSFEGTSMRAAPANGQIHPAVARLVELFTDFSPGVEISLDQDALHVGFLETARDIDGPITAAVKAALTPQPSPTNSSIAQTLHQMKDQISAARQAATIPPDVTATRRLSTQSTADLHLDQAQILAARLLAAGSLATTSTGTTELSSFLRAYGALLKQQLPIEFHVVVKSSNSRAVVALDKAHLSAILDTLVKNTQEALEGGGTIELSATTNDGLARIEFSDDGPGVPDNVLDAASSEQSVQSAEISGTDRGLLAIRNIVYRADGAFSYVPGRPGACWQITLPVSDGDSTEGDGVKASIDEQLWEGPEGEVGRLVLKHSQQSLDVYRADVRRVDEDAGQEEDLATGGYGRRQVFELVQNGADALIGGQGGRIAVILTAEALYCANEGQPLKPSGVSALMHAHISPKRGSEIGRFGLGFKSVLGVTRKPRFYSRTASFAFDGDEAERRIREVVGERENYPVLRLATPVLASEDAEQDPFLASMLEWATTIVKLPLDSTANWLSENIDDFPPEFLLFSPHVDALELNNRISRVQRTMSVDTTDAGLTLRDGEDISEWKVFSAIVTPSHQAKADAGKLAARDELPLEWAVPVDGRSRTGQFWAFFPLQDETTLTGIANAPWQVNDDRTGLLNTSRLNQELLDRLSDLVVSSIGALFKESDPGWVLDILPARGGEKRSWGDGVISADVYERLKGSACIADLTGHLRRVAELSVPPREVDRQTLEFWAAAPTTPADWCHPSTIWTVTRRSRVDRLLEAESLKPRYLSDWLESVIPENYAPADSRHAILLAGRLTGSEEDAARNLPAIRRSSIVLLATGQMAMVDPGSVFLPGATSNLDNGLPTVHPELAEDESVRRCLEDLGLQRVNPELELEMAAKKLRFSPQGRDSDWAGVWQIARSVRDPIVAATILRTELVLYPVRVKVSSGAWRYCNEVLFEGGIANAVRDAAVVVDAAFHAPDLEIIRALGVGSAPEIGYQAFMEPFYWSYLHECYQTYIRTDLGLDSRPAEARMEFVESEVCGPLAPIRSLSDEGRAEFTLALISSASQLNPWTLRHASQSKYPEMQFDSPVLKMVLTEGRLRTSVGIRRPSQCVGGGYTAWAELLPVVSLGPEREDKLGIPGSLAHLAARGDDGLQQWLDLCTHVEGSTDDSAVGAFFAEACEAGLPAPSAGVWCRVGDRHQLLPVADVAACDNSRTFAALCNLTKPAILAPDRDAVDALVTRWGVRSTDQDVRARPTWTASGANVALADYFPRLRGEWRERGILDYEVVPCSELAFEISTAAGTTVEDISFAVVDDDQAILWLTSGGNRQLLSELDSKYALELSAENFENVVAQRADRDTRRRLAELRAIADECTRLVQAVGTAVLKSHLPIGLLETVETLYGPADDRRLGELFLAVHGYDALRVLRNDFDEAGYRAPARWAGCWDARKFVGSLGFGHTYAGFRGSSRDRQVVVPGPSALPNEHPYQRDIIARLHALLTGDKDHKRAMLSLPTGAGKTRVAVQGLVELIASGRLRSPVLWIAQRDELCEQAVQSWSEVWRRYGSRAELTISRLWGANEVEESIAGPQTVIATIDKLRNRLTDGTYEWLAEASCVVVDEAHTATAPEYTRVLEWLGILRRGATTKTRCPLIGLTATPFRGTSTEQTKRLIDRFGGERLDSRPKDPYGDLQRLGVLAAVDGESLEGTSVELSDDDVSRFEQLRDVPRDVYRRIASDVERNRRLLKSIADRPKDWPILVFAISTEHAHTLAALLRLQGIEARSIDHETDTDLRRRYIDEFRQGKLRVLCNYSVLTQGFDAPAVRAVYVTRPTFSPNVYQQMIGRGLRGPLNGGKERCLIVNVDDNWNRFGDQLAFRDFEPLWDKT